MPVETQTVSINFGQGMDTKTDPKMVVSGKLQLLQDAIFTNSKRVKKRNGYTSMSLNAVGGGTISSPVMMKNYRNELVCAATGSNGKRLFSYSSALSAWSDCGKYNSIKSSKLVIDSPEDGNPGSGAPALGAVNPSSATLGNITLYAFDTGYANNATAVYITVVDQLTGAHLADRRAITSGLGFIKGCSKAVLLGSSALAVFYIGDSNSAGTPNSTARLCLRVITVTQAGGVVVGNEVVVGACLSITSSSTSPDFFYSYDVVTTSGGAFVAVANTPNVDLYTISTGGVASGPTTISSTGTIIPINVVLDSAGTNAWIYWVSAGTTLKYAIYNASTRASVLAATTAQTGLSLIYQVTALAVSASSQTLYLSTYTDPNGSTTMGVIYPKISQQTVQSNGTIGSVTPFVNGYDIYTKPFTLSGRNYMGIITLSPSVSTGFIVDLADTTAVAKFLPTQAEGVYTQGFNTTGATHQPAQIICVRMPSFLNAFTAQSASVYSIAAGFVVSYLTAAIVNTVTLAASQVSATVGATMGVASLSFDFNNIQANQSLVQQDTLVLNGSIVEQYDGAYISELGFNSPPDVITASLTNNLGHFPSGNWQYCYVYRWIDANGNLHQSAPSIPVQVLITTNTTNRVAIGFSPLTLTQKQNVSVSIYRNTSGGTIFYLLATRSNATTWDGFFDDYTETDALISTQPTLYTEGGAIIDNIAPPSSVVMWANANRIWAVDSENPETTIDYSKTASVGTGISFSSGILEVVVDSKSGEITGGSGMDEKTVILKQNGIGYFIGDGANDAGSGSTISTFQFIPSDTGCINSNSVVLFPDGVLFKSPKGIYIVTRGVQVAYFGIEVEAYNAQNVQSAVLTGTTNQIRFLTSSGSSLLYDYVFKQWSVFTNHTGYSADIWNGTYVYARADGSIYQENTTSFLDNTSSYYILAVLAWIKASSIQNFQRLRRVALLGDYQNAAGHGVQISAAYDWDGTAVSVIPYSFDGTTTFFQYRERLSIQKCDSVQLTIQEIVTGASGEYIDFSDLGIEIGAKKGLRKLGASQTVG